MLCFSDSSLSAELSRDEIESLVVQQLESWATGDEAAFLESLSDDSIFAYPGKRLDKKGALEVFKFWKDKFEKTKVYIHEIIIEENKFSVEYQFATTKKSNGTRTVTGTVTVGEVEDGKIKIWKEYLDGRVSRLQEKGELITDEGEEPFPWPKIESSD